VNDQRFIDLVLKKLGAPGNNPIDISLDRREALQRQVETQLRPVLRSRDYGSFQLDRAFAMVAELGARVRAAKGNGRRS
jgi:hypothetical protein